MKKVSRFWPFALLVLIVLLFFFPVFKGDIPFPGDLLVNVNPYQTQPFLGYEPGGYPNKGQGPDVIDEIYPWRYFSINQLKQGIIPFWNPYNFSGNPQMANFQTAVFYPLNFLYFLLPFNISWTLIIMLQPFLAGLFMYLFLKKGIGLKDFPSFIGGISFAFSSYMVVWIEYGNIGHTFMWLPLVLLLTKYFFQKTSAKNLFGISIVLSLSILAGYIQGAFYVYVLCFIYYFYLSLGKKGGLRNYKKNLLFFSSLIFPIFLTSFQILPTLQIFLDSTRGAYTLSQIQKILAPPYYWITIIFPDFFGNPTTRNYWINGTYIERVMYPGTVIVFFALYSLFNKIKISEKKLFAGLSLFSLIIATNLPFVKYFYLIPIPVISTTYSTRELSVFIFSFIVLGSIGLDYYLKENIFKSKIIALYLGFFASVWAVLFILLKTDVKDLTNLKITEHNLIIPTILTVALIFAVYIKNKSRKISLILIALIVFVDLFYFFNKITPFSPSALIYPSSPIISFLKSTAGINRFWGYGTAYIPANFQTVDNTYSPEGNDPLHISTYGELLSSSSNGELPEILPRPDANIASGYGSSNLGDNFYRKRILDLLGVKYILNKQGLKDAWNSPDLTTFPISQYTMVKKIYPWQVYQNKDAVPRFFITGNFVLAKNKKEALSYIYSPAVDLKKTLILENKPNIPVGLRSTGRAKLISYAPNQVLFSVNASENTLLFLSDNYYSEWGVLIDGKPSKILVADYTFRAVAIPKGEHRVEFYYDPKSFKIGLTMGIVGLVVLLLLLFYVKKLKEKI